MKKIKILFVDDDIMLGEIVTQALSEKGYEIHYQTSLAGIQAVVRETRPDMIILDVEIGEKNGIDITPELKIIAPQTPILFVSSHVGSHDAARALNAGGFAYLKKPFDIEELLAYINRNATPSSSGVIPVGNLSFHPEENLLTKNGQPIKKLSAMESRLLKYLILNKNKVVTRRELERELWGKEKGNAYSLNNYIGKLRKTLTMEESVDLVTVSKVGYKLIL